MNILSVKNLVYYFQDGDARRYILNDISCNFERGRLYVISGESGSGKTTFLSLVSALDKPKGGEITYEGKPISAIGYDNYRRNNVGIIFQSYNLIPYMTPLENLLTAMSITDNQLPADKKTVAYNLLNFIGITRDKATRVVNKLSGGEQQRVAIARALATNVDLILADEPTGNLNEEMENEITDIFLTLAHEQDKCVIIVSHSLRVAEKADVVLKLKGGRFDNELS